MIEAVWLAGALAGGFALGLLFFLGLWLTVRRLPNAEHPALITLISLLGRTAAVLSGFYLLSGGRWPPLALAVAGFVAGRTWMVRRLRPNPALSAPASE